MSNVVTIGDVYVDFVSNLQDMSPNEISNNLAGNNLFAPVEVKVGGAGVHFAVAARKTGFDISTLIGKIGSRVDTNKSLTADAIGSSVVDYLYDNDVRPLLAIDPTSETGRVLLAYLPSKQRLMVSDPLANALFTEADITTEMRDACRLADLMFVSGYTLVKEHRRNAVLSLMQEAKRGGRATIAIELTPHNLYQHMTFAQLRSHIDRLADWVFVEIRSAHQLLGFGAVKEISTDIIERVFDTFVQSFPSFCLSITAQRDIIFDGGVRWEEFSDFEYGAAYRGRSAEIQAKLLYTRLIR